MKKPLICASLACACAFALQAGTNDWFTAIGSTASASSYASVNGTWDTNTYVTAGGEVTWDGTAKKFSFDLEDSEYITFNATSGTSPDTNTVTRVEVSGAFTPVSTELPSDSAMNERLAQVGFVVSTNGASGFTYKAWYGAGWVALSNGTLGAPAGSDAETDLIVEFDYSHRLGAHNFNCVSFYIKSAGTEYLLTDGSETKFQMTSTAGAASNQVAGVSCYGSGTISKADGAVEMGIASVNGIKYASLNAAANEATTGETIVVLNTPDAGDTATLANGVKISDPSQKASGASISVADGGTATIKATAAESNNGVSGSCTVPLDIALGEGSKVAIELDSVASNKEVTNLVVGATTVTFDIQTKTEILAAANPGGNKALSANVAKLRQFIAADEALNTADVAADVSTASIQTALQANGGNGIPKWESYVLGIAPNASIKPVTKPAGDTSTTAITLAIPAINSANYSGDYTVKYKVGDGEEQSDPSAIEVPLTTGTKTIKAVLKP